MASTASTLLLRFLARRGHTTATASAIGAACAMTPGEVRGHLAALESQRLVAGRHDAMARPPGRVFGITAEGLRAAGLVGGSATT